MHAFSTQCVYAQWAQADSFGTSLSPAMVLHIKLPNGEVRTMTVGDARKAIKVRVAQVVQHHGTWGRLGEGSS
jgi:hypothetical protein